MIACHAAENDPVTIFQTIKVNNSGKVLEQVGVDDQLNAVDEETRGPLMTVVPEGRPELVKLLVEKRCGRYPGVSHGLDGIRPCQSVHTEM